MVDPRFFKAEKKSIADIAKLTQARLTNPDAGKALINGVNSLKMAVSGEIAFYEVGEHARRALMHLKDELAQTKASAVFITEEDAEGVSENVCGLIVENPREAYRQTCVALYPETRTNKIEETAQIDISVKFANKKTVSVGHNTVIEANVEFGKNVSIGHNCVIKEGCVIGDNTVIHNNVTLSHTLMGSDGVIFSGARLGTPGFGYASSAKGHFMIPQMGRVIIGNRVEIGANSCLDRGALDDTVVGDGTKIDNLVHLAHGTVIGKNCFICGQAGFAGGTVLEDFVIAAAQTGFAGHLTVGAGSQVAGQSGVISSLPPQSKVVGFPARPIKEFYKELAFVKRLMKKKD